MTQLKLDLSPEGSEVFCSELLEMVATVVDLKIHSVEQAADTLKIEPDQLNHILDRNIADLTFGTLISIGERTGVVFDLRQVS